MARSALRALTRLALLALGTLATTSASASDLVVKYDQSQLIRLPRPVSEIIIGNPSIADVTVKSPTLLIITGKSFGITNIISLDADHNVIQDQRVMVERDEVKTVNLSMGGARRSYNCSPQCNPTVTVGDETAFLSSVSDAAQKKMAMSKSGDAAGSP